MISVVIPAYNEESAIGPVVAGVRAAYAHVVVVDDGSTDRTGAVARAAGAIVLRHPINLGQGAALQTGIDFALLEGATEIVTFDADGQHAVGDIGVLRAVAARGLDVVLGSRSLGGTVGITRARAWLLRAAVLFTRMTTGLRLTDAHNGLRLLSAGAARRIRLRQNGMAHASELLSQVARLRLRYAEAPVVVTYTAYSRAKGQRMGNALFIVLDLALGRLSR